MHIVSTEERVQETVVRAGGTGQRYDYIGSPGTIDANPQAFLVERLYTDARIDPHFHDIDQFQVVVEGFCKMGKKPTPPVTFQYADAYTPYGPIVGEKEGFAFFTLRPIASGGFFPMPGNRHHMPGRAGRNIAGQFDAQRKLPDAGTLVTEVLMPEQQDHVKAVGYWLGPEARLATESDVGGGRYYLVCAGAVRSRDKVLTRHSVIHISSGEPTETLVATDEGAAVLALQFAVPSERPGSDPSKLAARDPDSYRMVPNDSGR